MDGSTERGSENPGIKALMTLAALAREWRLLVFFPLSVAAVTAVVSLILPHRFVANASFVPEESPSSGIPASVAGLAAQFGVSVPATGSRSSEFYAGLLRSRNVSNDVLTTAYVLPGWNSALTLVNFLEVKGESESERLEEARKALEDVLSISTDRQTGVVQLSIELKNPVLAAEVANRYLDALNDFNLHVRESVGRAKREFIQSRLDDARERLLVAETGLLDFQERNVRFQDSPQLVLEEARLRRAVAVAQDLFTSHAREFELARIAEVNDTPVITVLDRAVVPVKRSSPRRTLLVLAAGVLAGLIAVGIALARVKLAEFAHDHPESIRRLRRILSGSVGTAPISPADPPWPSDS